MEKWRFIDLGRVDMFHLFGIEEAIINSDQPNTVLLWIVDKPTASVGYFQSVEQELNVDRCKENGIIISRRPCGGGAVYFDDHELYYSVIEKGPEHKLPDTVDGSFKKACMGLIYALENLGIKAEFSGKNDVTVNGKKISGNAQARPENAYIIHGTFLYDFDFEMATKTLNIPIEKFADKGISLLKDRIVTIKELRPDVTMEQVKEEMKKGFARALNVEFIDGKLTDEELENSRRYMKKYSSDEWNFRR